MKLILFFLLISSSESLTCITDSLQKFQFSTSPLNTTNIEKIINQRVFRVFIAECQVQLIMHHDKQLLEIISIPVYSNGAPSFSSDPEMIVTFTSNHYNSSIVSELEYACSSSSCDRDFIRKRYLLLVEKDYTDLRSNLTKLLVKEKNSPFTCINMSSIDYIQLCHSMTCTAAFSISCFGGFVNNGWKYGCARNDQNLAVLRISTIYAKPLGFIHAVYYTCTYNECNHNSTTISIYNIIQTSVYVFNILIDSNINVTDALRTPTTFTNTAMQDQYSVIILVLFSLSLVLFLK